MVRIGQSYQIEIVDFSHDGEGVGRIENMVIFVPRAVPGDFVLVEITLLKKNYARATIKQMIKTSPQRINPACKVVGECGGCQLAQINYNQQLKWKQQRVASALSRIGHTDTQISPIIGMPNPFAYRNKAQIQVGKGKDKLIAGFYQRGTNDIVDLNGCKIHHPLISQAISGIKQVLVDLNIAPYNKLTNSGVLKQIVIRASFNQNTLMVVLITGPRDFPQKFQLVQELSDRIPGLVSIVQTINQGKGSRANTLILWGESYLIERIGQLKFAISPDSFFQVNPIQTEILYNTIKETAALTGKEIVWDLYCGTGSIGLYLARDAKRVIGVESVTTAVKDAKLNAKLNGIDNVEFHLDKAEHFSGGPSPQVIVVDPPRSGCDPNLLETIGKKRPNRLVYVSCNPATLARDIKILLTMKYNVVQVQPVDMFPQTSHVECVVLMSRVEK